jgi:hypothetical protein
MQGVDAPPALNPNPDLLQLAVPDQQQDPFHCDELFFQIGLVNIGHKKVECVDMVIHGLSIRKIKLSPIADTMFVCRICFVKSSML